MTAEQFRPDPKMTTSVERQEQVKEEREETGSYFGDRVRTVTPSLDTPPPPLTRAIQEPPRSVAYDRPYSHLTDTQKALYNEDLRNNDPVVYRLKEAQKKDESNRGWRYKFEREGGHIK